MRDAFRGENTETLTKIWIMHHKTCHIKPPLHSASFSGEPNFSHTNPLNLPELNPCYLCLFSRLYNGLKFRRFASLRDIQQQATAGPKAITNGIYRGSLTNCTVVASVYVCRGRVLGVTDRCSMYIILCTGYVQRKGTGCDWLMFYVYHTVYRLCAEEGYWVWLTYVLYISYCIQVMCKFQDVLPV
jgi:hypothetical protein